MRALACGAVALLAWRLARRGGAPPWAALGAWLAATLALAYPSGPHPFPVTLALCLGALLCLERPALAGALTGVAAFWRIEFAAYLALGVLLAYAVRGAWARAAARYAAAAVATRRAAVRAVRDGGGPGRRVRAARSATRCSTSATTSRCRSRSSTTARSTPARSAGFLSDSAENLLLFYLPLALVLALVAARSRPARCGSAARTGGGSPSRCSRSGCCTTCWRAPTRSTRRRSRCWSAVLAAWAAPALRRALRRRGSRAACGGAAPCARASRSRSSEVAFAIVEGVAALAACARGGTPLALPVADGVRVPEPRGARRSRRRSRRSRRRVPPGDADLRRCRARSDLVTAGNPLLYVLADRPNPTRYDIQAPGVVTSRAGPARDRRRPRARPPAGRRARHVACHRGAGAQRGRALERRDAARRVPRASDYREVARYGPLVVLEPAS